MKIVIVGAGPCGLVALKELREHGLDATILERRNKIGGTFTTIAPGQYLTFSNWAMAYSDFPDPTRLHYPSAGHYLHYLHRYAREFGLDPHIRLGTEVRRASLSAEDRWTLEVHHQATNSTSTIFAEFLVVATGANSFPKATPLDLVKFDGHIIHSKDYDDRFKRQVSHGSWRVLIVGGGESAADISVELSEVSSEVSVWLRRPPCVGGRYLNSQGERAQVEKNVGSDRAVNELLEANTTSRMGALLNPCMRGVFLRLLWHSGVLHRTVSKWSLQSAKRSLLMGAQANVVTKNQGICEAMDKGALETIICPSVDVDGRACSFIYEDGTSTQRQYDAVVLCTGFELSFPWLCVDGITSNLRDWFLHCFPPGLGHRLAFLGFARPQQGGIPIMAEILARYLSLILSGLRQLPPNYGIVASQNKADEEEYFFLSPAYETLVDYNAFLESVARYIGCQPSVPTSCHAAYLLNTICGWCLVLRTLGLGQRLTGVGLEWAAFASSTALLLFLHKGIMVQWWFHPFWAFWYRQRGPGANPSQFSIAITRAGGQKFRLTPNLVLLTLWSVPCFCIQIWISLILYIPYSIARIAGTRFTQAWGGLLRPRLFALHNSQWGVEDLFSP